MRKLQEKNKLNQFKDSFLKMNPFNDFKPNSDEAILCDLLTTIAEQIRDRYGAKMMPMITAFSQGKKLLAGKSFENLTLSPNRSFENEIPYDSYVNSAQTPYQLFLLSFIWSTQKLASAGLINKKDKWGEALAIFKKVVCCEALLKILYKATIQDEFTVKLSDHITLPCGKFYAHEPSEENPNVLVAVEHFIENELSGKGDIDDPSSDLISIISMISKFSPEEKNLFLNYYSVNYLKSLYTLKSIQENEMLDVIKTKEDFDQLPNERKEAFKSLATELSDPLKRLDEKYFNWMGAPIWENVKLLKNPLPTILKPVNIVSNEEKIEQPIQFKYLDESFHQLVTFQNAPLCNKPPKELIQDWNKVQGRSLEEKIVIGIGTQYLIIKNQTNYGNCMYGALSRIIFGKNVDDSNVDYFSGQLRKAAAKYMRDHKDQFTSHMSIPSDIKKQNETDENYQKRLKPILEERFVTYCSDLEDKCKCGTELEMMVISDIFGVEVQVFNTRGKLCQIVDGIIQPNAGVGNHYKGKQPIRLIFVDGNHFKPLIPIT